MHSPRPLVKVNKPENEVEEKSSRISRLSPRNILSAIGSRFFNLSQESTESNQTTVIHIAEKRPQHTKEKLEKEEKSVEKQGVSGKEGKKHLLHHKIKELRQKHERNIDRDLRRYKAKYNTSMGNIVRDWMSLIYCILILRVNLIKFVVKNLPECSDSETHLHDQILLESKTLFSLIRDAQHFCQEKFIVMWTQLEKLLFNGKVFKSAQPISRLKENGLRDWKTAATKLTELENEFDKYTEEYKVTQESKVELENTTKETIAKLEKLIYSKETEYNLLVEKITELKKREVQMRGRILINMKSYKDLKAKKQKLINVEKEMDKLNSEQTALIGEYSSKIQTLKSEIEDKEKQIREEKEEKKKLKASLEGLGDFTEKRSSVTVHEN